MRIEKMKVTPQIAIKWLRDNEQNRSISDATIDGYARTMKEKQWVVNGESIKFDINGRLIDGQHRLLACIRSQATFETFVVFDCPLGVQDSIDIGRKRSVGDQLAIAGKQYANNLAATIRAVIAIATEASSVKITALEAKSFIDKWPSIERSVELAAYGNGCKPTSRAIMGAMHFITSTLLDKKELADEFLWILLTGEARDLSRYEKLSDNPVYRLREKLLLRRMSRVKMNAAIELLELIYVWNKFVEGKRLRVIKLPQTVRISGFVASDFGLDEFSRIGVSDMEKGEEEYSQTQIATNARNKRKRGHTIRETMKQTTHSDGKEAA